MNATLPPLLLEAHAFAVRLLRGGEEAWLAPAGLGQFHAELARWLALEHSVLDLGALLATRLDAGLPRDTDAIVALLEDAALHACLAEGIAAVHGNGRPVYLALPAPGCLHAASGAPGPAVDMDLDELALGLAALLRACCTPSLAGVLVEECSAGALAFSQPLVKLAAHRGVAPLLAFDGVLSGPPPAGFLQCYDRAGSHGGRFLPAIGFAGEADPAPGPVFARVRADCEPEALLATLARLRAAGVP